MLFENPLKASHDGFRSESDLLKDNSVFTGGGCGDIIRRTVSGETVSAGNSLTLSSYYAAMRNISEDVAKMPLITYRRLENKGKEPATDHNLFRLLSLEPNHEMSSMEFRETMQHWALGWGGGYAEIERNSVGDPVALWPIHPSRVMVKRDAGGNIVYQITGNDISLCGSGFSDFVGIILPAKDVFHIHPLGPNGITGYPLSVLASECVGAAKAAQIFGAAFFGNGLTISGTYTHPHALDETARKTLRAELSAFHVGASSSSKAMLLEEGITFKPTSIAPEQAQFLETKRFDVEEVARWFRIPPHKIGHIDASPKANVEQQSIEYVNDTLLSWTVRWEQEIQLKLVDEDDQGDIFAEHLFDILLRTNTKERFESHSIGLMNAFLTVNEVRVRENLNPVEGGDEIMRPLNMVSGQGVGDTPGRTGVDNRNGNALLPAPDIHADVERCKKRMARMFADATARMLYRESNAATRKAQSCKDDPQAFVAWVDKFYAKHADDINAALTPAGESMAEELMDITGVASTITTCLSGFVAAHVETSKASLVTGYDTQTVPDVCGDWMIDRPAAAAVTITENIAAEFAK